MKGYFFYIFYGKLLTIFLFTFWCMQACQHDMIRHLAFIWDFILYEMLSYTFKGKGSEFRSVYVWMACNFLCEDRPIPCTPYSRSILEKVYQILSKIEGNHNDKHEQLYTRLSSKKVIESLNITPLMLHH